MRKTSISLFALLIAIATTAWGMDEQVTAPGGRQLGALSVYGIVFALSLGGMASHYLKKWLTGQIEGSLFNYLFRDNPRRTGLAVFTLIGVVGAAIAAGQFDGVSLQQLFMPAWLLGYTVDSVANKGASPA